METPVTASYQMGYVMLSYAMSVLGGFVALTSAMRIRQRNGSLHFGNTVAAGLALGGIGVWSMHFIGMLALRLDVGSAYSVTETVVSLVAAVIGSALALRYVAKAPRQLGRLVLAGVLLGLGVVVMHYLGMYGMKINGFIRWDMGIVGVSVLIAIVAATAALWLAFNTHGLALRTAAGLLMGVAVCAMHYTGMQAAEFICTTTERGATPKGFGFLHPSELPNVVAFGSITIAVLIVIYLLFQESSDVEGDLQPAFRTR
jgi:NO-binding membrane sensor protein with MHYT domain